MGRNYQDYQHVEETLPNGLRLIYLDLPHAHGAAIVGSVRGGPVCETSENLGVSHLLEHLHLSVSSRYPSRLEMLRALDDLPGDVDAETNHCSILFEFDVPPDYLVEASVHFAEILQHRPFPSDVIESEKALLATELTSMEEYRSFPMEKLFGRHPYGQPHGGHSMAFRRLTVDQIEEFDRRMFAPDEMTVCVVGPLREGRLDAIRENLAAIRPGGSEGLSFPPMPTLQLPRVEFIKYRSKMCHSSIAFVATYPLTPSAYCAYTVARMGLTRLSSPLYEQLRYRLGIAYLFATDWTTLPEMRIFWVFGETMGRNRDRFLMEVIRELRSTCDSATPRPWFEPARLDYLYTVERALDFPKSVARRLLKGAYQFEGDVTSSIPEEIQTVREMTWGAARDAYASLFKRENLFVCTQYINRFLDDRRLRRFVSGLW